MAEPIEAPDIVRPDIVREALRAASLAASERGGWRAAAAAAAAGGDGLDAEASHRLRKYATYVMMANGSGSVSVGCGARTCGMERAASARSKTAASWATMSGDAGDE
ncbi:uncharacterized protein AMSG_11782 [Thecamonas trahens ATCC 50062]|uniref:Uncharacterized protein n=1 Tax=Thecamonas trahens ATCC 50062 TaxID=461836 RepID=A0A0L0D7N1_THETB|nr:hypothetical protein AMSG_11782 [Thecamonas trahens ATCC 50062]KNC47313.1 hypothetical protein AMSG_11782 [Thecamonas trahens ATCC 50062]|eukprot:XP_013759771.1 hypothetical protein AMSG_11782 [Thecamonas trahens ATCC 50062]